ncbi:methylated-DNA--[protein]-cysteine S-methyltransferase [Naasia lichenicola]|uniref:Methylated-DNA--[protein]-cysteine S-methyltransferase n=1 Tax=Naasia lichenicola TaxID=2565933 RepID=A0A4S4FFZ6_9MICO|nr:methylated-DNA--[protein]-cysteine S-methyltransferase [Naasia lichenicola]THG28604.1 methylated-DNA--[protein]-cysteine S-methyltransferase [Naasia lichenicola]
MTPSAALTAFVSTPDGPFGILATDEHEVLASGWTDDVDALVMRLTPTLRPTELREDALADVVAAVERYYAGDFAAIDSVRVRQSGGPFRSVAWAALRTIEPGHPLTYTEFATASGRPSAVRAAASACATNAPALFVPCHRVLRTDGTMGGFAWGVPVKRSLLAREAA